MTNQEMITAILQAIQTDANLMILLRRMVANNINVVVPADRSVSPQLQAICLALGISP